MRPWGYHRVWNPLMVVTPSFVLIGILAFMTEMTIRSNNVAPGESQWSLGQTLSLAVALIPAKDLLYMIAKESGLELRVDYVVPFFHVIRNKPGR